MKNNIDKYNMLSVIKDMPMQIREALELGNNIKSSQNINKIFVCGMGGSGISGMILSSYLNSIKCKIPIFIIQDYSLPCFADETSLFFIISYSGNTEESISCYKEAVQKSKNIIVITTGGKLQELSKKDNISCILIPKGYQPRNAVSFLFFPMLNVLKKSKIINFNKEIAEKIAKSIEKNTKKYESLAKSLAKKLYMKIPIIYSSSQYIHVSYRWKCEFNENSKIPSFFHFFPELNHNELNSYENFQRIKFPFAILILNLGGEHERNKKRIKITKDMIKKFSSNEVQCIQIEPKGENFLEKTFNAIYFGDLLSYYLALLYKTDPSPVKMIEKFKKDLGSWKL